MVQGCVPTRGTFTGKDSTGVCVEGLDLRASQVGDFFEGPNNKDHHILGCILRFPLFRESTS